MEHRTGTQPAQVRFPGAARDFFSLPESTFGADSLTVSVHPPCAIVCTNIRVHVKDPVVHVRVRWMMETRKYPACTAGWIARLCRSWFSPGKESSPTLLREKSQWDKAVVFSTSRKDRGQTDRAQSCPRHRHAEQNYKLYRTCGHGVFSLTRRFKRISPMMRML